MLSDIFDLIFSGFPESLLMALIGIGIFRNLKKKDLPVILIASVLCTIAIFILHRTVHPVVKLITITTGYTFLYYSFLGSWRKALTSMGIVYFLIMVGEYVSLVFDANGFRVSSNAFYYYTVMSIPARTIQIIVCIAIFKLKAFDRFRDPDAAKSLFSLKWHKMSLQRKATITALPVCILLSVLSGTSCLYAKFAVVRANLPSPNLDIIMTFGILSSCATIITVTIVLIRTVNYEIFEDLLVRTPEELTLNILRTVGSPRDKVIRLVVDEYFKVMGGGDDVDENIKKND